MIRDTKTNESGSAGFSSIRWFFGRHSSFFRGFMVALLCFSVLRHLIAGEGLWDGLWFLECAALCIFSWMEFRPSQNAPLSENSTVGDSSEGGETDGDEDAAGDTQPKD